MTGRGRKSLFWFCLLRGTALVAASAVASALIAQQPDQPSMPNCVPERTLSDRQGDVKANPHSSLARYCLAELLLQQREYQASVNEYRFALSGDKVPSWTIVWSHVQIGKIFDLTLQRDRAVLEYRRAIESGDNTGGALTRARESLDHPFVWPDRQ